MTLLANSLGVYKKIKKQCRHALKVCAAFVFFVFFACVTAAQTLEDLTQQNFAQRSLANVLSLYQRAGLPIIYSNALVASDDIVYYSPPAGEPLVRLRAVLELFNLGLESENIAQTWLVVKKPADFTAQIKITDANTGLPLMNATLAEQGRASVVLDNASNIELNIFADSVRQLRVSHAGCQTQVFALAQLKPENTFKLVCELKPSIEETLVVASFYRWQKASSASHNNITQDDLAQLPSRGNDPMQMVAALPGMANSGASAKLNVRGGASDELLMLFNGVELIEPFHLKDFQGLLSGINSHNLERLDIYSGGYPAQYGSKMSGVIDITPIKPSGENDNLIELNPIFSAFMLAGFTDAKKPENYYIASVQRGNLETTLRTFEKSFGTPRFNDTFLQYYAKLNNTQTYDMGFLSIRDDVALQLSDDRGGEQAQSVYNSQYGWLKTTINHSKKFTSQIQLSSTYSKTRRQGELVRVPNDADASDLKVNDLKASEANRLKVVEGNSLKVIETNSFRASGEGHLNDDRLFSLQNLSYFGLWQFEKKQRLHFGGQAQYAKARYDYSAEVERGDLAILLGVPAQQTWAVVQNPSGVNASSFLSWYSLPTEHVMTELGVRADMQTYATHTQYQLSPRMALNYQFDNDVTFKASAGRFYQAPSIVDLDVTAGQDNFYAPQKADHYIVGVDYPVTEALRIGVEGYLKKLFSPRPRAENLFNPYVLLPELADDRVYLKPSRGTAEGIELSVNYVASENLRSWFSFSTSEVEDKIVGRAQRRGWNQVMAASLSALYQAPSWSVSARWHWHSGWPTTTLPVQVNSVREPLNYTRNDTRLSEFLSLDVRVNKDWTWAGHRLEGYVDITNLTNRNNIGYRQLILSPLAEDDSYALTSERKNLFSIFPVVGLVLHF
ncbi:MAG: TonB-dependent receptor [Marinagarivorans sp.]|nr:TonB-dependent receptor [Marinagarivorans sp.]